MKRLLTALALLLAPLSLSACAQPARLVDVQVLDQDTGQFLPRLPHAGRTWLEGQPGHRFALTLQNLTGERVLAVVSVDGVNVISGETAGSQQSGYVLGPWERVDIRGWRKSTQDVAEFYFTALGDSYAARTGRPANVGVIGVAAFRERQPEPPPAIAAQPLAEAHDAAPASAAPMAPMAKSLQSSAGANSPDAQRRADNAVAQQLGAGHGERRYDPVTLTSFERASLRPAQLLALYYDSYESLVARGVLPRRPAPAFTPDPFPIGFVPDPAR